MDLKIYAKTIEAEAQEQVYRMAKSEAYSGCQIRIMPDCHAGKGCTVGTVIKIKDRVVPNTVGVDIGCGMLVSALGSVDIDLEQLVNKFDIAALKPFDKVLVRGNAGQKWTHDFFGFMDKDKGYPFVCVGHYVNQCIPYEGNEHLLGTTNDCDEFYKTWTNEED